MLIHAIKDCPMAREVLKYGGLNNKFLTGNYSQCIDWIEDMARKLDNTVISELTTVLWNVWNNRNNSIFRGVEDDAKVTWERTVVLSKDFQIFNLLEDLMVPKKAKEKVWQKLTQGVGKFNFDATVQGKKAYYRLITRDSDGLFLVGKWAIWLRKCKLSGPKCKLWKKA
ncbi:hypothetical protein J1N35_011561 [Gossypium stocksii]|uniref:Uncharacterized protein n=1 Tax=Gossypium stocksii TaxID=47602 RepID=A0A9D3W4G4_9ROSI|nr:hypothetical protein J1N35_011561 [Gossypium stocksii]